MCGCVQGLCEVCVCGIQCVCVCIIYMSKIHFCLIFLFEHLIIVFHYNNLEHVIIFMNAMAAGRSANNRVGTTVLLPNFVF